MQPGARSRERERRQQVSNTTHGLKAMLAEARPQAVIALLNIWLMSMVLVTGGLPGQINRMSSIYDHPAVLPLLEVEKASKVVIAR